MNRRMLKLLAVLSLLLCGAVAVMWVRSYLPADFYVFSRQGRVMVVFAESTRSALFSPREGRAPGVITPWADAQSSARVHWQALGLEFMTGPSPRPAPAAPAPPGTPAAPGMRPGFAFRPMYVPGEYVMFAASYAWLAAPAVAAAAASIYFLRRGSARRREGLCRSCGYDLRGSPQSPRCPECGTEVTAA
jgi:hypothetical protein